MESGKKHRLPSASSSHALSLADSPIFRPADDLAAAGTTGAGSAFQGTSNDIFTSYNTDANISTSSANHPIYNFDINTAGAATGLGLALAQQPGLAFPATHDGLEAPELASAGTPPRAPAHGRRAASHNGLRVGPLFDPSEPIVQCPGCGKKNLSVGYLGKDPKGRHRAWRLSHMTPGRKDAARGRGIPCEYAAELRRMEVANGGKFR